MALAGPPASSASSHSSLGRGIARAAAIGLVLVLSAGLLLWWSGPALLAPVDDFPQGPGGAIAYVSLSNQIRDQAVKFWTGGDVQLRLNEAEFGGMLASALLSGRRPGHPIERVRGSLEDGEIRVDAIIRLPPSVPERFRGPVGLRLWLQPVVTESGLVEFRITRAFAGRIPVPPAVLRLAGRLYPISVPGYNAREATISLPLGDMVSRMLGRELQIKEFTAEGGQLTLTIAMRADRKQP